MTLAIYSIIVSGICVILVWFLVKEQFEYRDTQLDLDEKQAQINNLKMILNKKNEEFENAKKKKLSNNINTIAKGLKGN